MHFCDMEKLPAKFAGLAAATGLECAQSLVAFGVCAIGVRLDNAPEPFVSETQGLHVFNGVTDAHSTLLFLSSNAKLSGGDSRPLELPVGPGGGA